MKDQISNKTKTNIDNILKKFDVNNITRLYTNECIWKKNLKDKKISKKEINLLKRYCAKSKDWHVYNMLCFIEYNVMITEGFIEKYSIYDSKIPYSEIRKRRQELKQKGLYNKVLI